MSEMNEKLQRVIEAVLFASPEPLTVSDLRKLLAEFPPEEIERAADACATRYESDPDIAFGIERVGGGFQFRSSPRYAAYVRRLYEKEKQMRLTPAALETLACVAYRQPITKSEVDEIRGVDSGASLRSLVERGLVRMAGRRVAPGRPLTHVTTSEFLAWFGLNKLEELPTMAELEGSPAIPSLPLNLSQGGLELVESTATDELPAIGV